jgi:integrase
VVAFVTGPTQKGTKPANNTVRNRLACVRTFLRWCADQGIPVPRLSPDDVALITTGHPHTYGRAQARNKARFLTHDQAFGQLIGACSDGTWIGSRDQLLIRLGLLGIRAHELIGLRWGDLGPDGVLRWTGKKNVPRSANLGPTLVDLLARWERRYAAALDRPVTASDPILCKARPGNWTQPRDLLWGQPITSTRTVWQVVTDRAATAGLGHVAPHDLRRSAAAIMHTARGSDGGHLFDLEDITKVLDQVNPITTRRSYLDHLDRRAKTNAAAVLD